MLLVGIGWSTFTAFSAGFIHEAFNLGGLFLGVILAGQYYGLVAEYLSPFISGELARVAGFAIVFIGVGVIAHLVASLLHNLLAALALGWLDNLGGALFGLARAALIALTILTVLTSFPVPLLSDVIAQSQVAALILQAKPLLLALLPPEFASFPGLFGGGLPLPGLELPTSELPIPGLLPGLPFPIPTPGP